MQASTRLFDQAFEGVLGGVFVEALDEGEPLEFESLLDDSLPEEPEEPDLLSSLLAAGLALAAADFVVDRESLR